MLPYYVRRRIGKKLWDNHNHPLGILTNKVHEFFRTRPKPFQIINDQVDFEHELENPIVTVANNFNELLFPRDHPSRSPSDTFYLLPSQTPAKSQSCETVGFRGKVYEEDELAPGTTEVHLSSETKLLRTHTTAHQVSFLNKGLTRCIWTADVYRKDEVNASHSSVFHQTDGFKIWSKTERALHDKEIIGDLQTTLSELATAILGSEVKQRWSPDSFPFTEPSCELEVKTLVPAVSSGKPAVFTESWIELLGGGVIRNEILETRQPGFRGWAFGMGLERLAMVACQIPDIRLFWSEDPRFKIQYADGMLNLFKPFSKLPSTTRDLAVWFPSDGPSDSQAIDQFTKVLAEYFYQEAPDLAYNIQLRDHFNTDGRYSLGWRLTYQAFDRTLTNEEVNLMHFNGFKSNKDGTLVADDLAVSVKLRSIN